MIVRRLLVGLLLTGLAAPALAAAPPHRELRPPREAPLTIPGSAIGRVLVRADAGPEGPAAAEPAESPVAASLPSPEIAARARAEFEANRAGRIDRTHYTSELNEKITDAALADAAASLRRLGEVRRFVQVRKVTNGAAALYVFKIECEHAPAIEQTIGWNAAGKVDVLQFGLPR
jgi:hypothetical protein